MNYVYLIALLAIVGFAAWREYKDDRSDMFHGFGCIIILAVGIPCAVAIWLLVCYLKLKFGVQ